MSTIENGVLAIKRNFESGHISSIKKRKQLIRCGSSIIAGRQILRCMELRRIFTTKNWPYRMGLVPFAKSLTRISILALAQTTDLRWTMRIPVVRAYDHAVNAFGACFAGIATESLD